MIPGSGTGRRFFVTPVEHAEIESIEFRPQAPGTSELIEFNEAQFAESSGGGTLGGNGGSISGLSPAASAATGSKLSST